MVVKNNFSRKNNSIPAIGFNSLDSKIIISNLFETERDNSGLKTDSLLHFGTIATYSFKEFSKKLNKTNNKIQLDDIKSQIYINSQICSNKYNYYNKSLNDFKWVVILILIGKTIGIL